MARFCSLSSSSKGNCAYLAGGSTSVLVDAGVSLKQIATQLKKCEADLSEIDGILITHEHSDHIKGLNVLTNKYNIPIYSTAETLNALVGKGVIAPHTKLVEIESGNFCLGDLQITAFDTPHDTPHSVGYTIKFPDETKVGIATDMGNVTTEVRENLEGCNLVMIESNYDRRMLECSRYPYILKRRIKGELGHLDNEDCAREIVHLVRTGTTRLILGHLSEENNMPRLAYETARLMLLEHEMAEGRDYLIEVAPARQAGNMAVI